jgi:hypothetical protein
MAKTKKSVHQAHQINHVNQVKRVQPTKGPYTRSDCAVKGPKGEPIIYCSSCWGTHTFQDPERGQESCTDYSVNDDEARANADFIVKACNNYEVMRDLLDKASAQLFKIATSSEENELALNIAALLHKLEITG